MRVASSAGIDAHTPHDGFLAFRKRNTRRLNELQKQTVTTRKRPGSRAQLVGPSSSFDDGSNLVRLTAATAAVATLLVVSISSEAGAQSLRQATEAAWSRNAERQALEAQRNAALARRRAADSLIPAPPSLTASYVTDRPGRNLGRHEVEAEFSVPVWLPGEGRASRRVGDSELARLDTQLAAQRLATAGEVREAYWNVAAAQAALTAAQRRRQTAQATERDFSRQVRAGQAARSEQLQAEAELADAESTVREQDTALRDAVIQFRTLTGMEPGSGWLDPLRAGVSIEEHPRLAALRRASEAARAELRLTEIQDRESPEIGVFGRFERDSREESFNRIVGVRVRIPFATSARNEPRITRAQAESTRAAAEYLSAERQLRGELDRLRPALTAAREQQALAERRHRALTNQAALLERSYRAGEVSFAELLRTRLILYDADLARMRGAVAVQRLQSQLNQVLAVEP
jgi:outer membrane protein, heavy metal efflux system